MLATCLIQERNIWNIIVPCDETYVRNLRSVFAGFPHNGFQYLTKVAPIVYRIWFDVTVPISGDFSVTAPPTKLVFGTEIHTGILSTDEKRKIWLKFYFQHRHKTVRATWEAKIERDRKIFFNKVWEEKLKRNGQEAIVYEAEVSNDFSGDVSIFIHFVEWSLQ